ncbi:hypothetical protein [Prosthecobacter vanneervenii]|uniref:Putative membrane-anchored protein n=1 Tax=Prosthecobacter vanneervenii TaxID=48466 RepID=A0A7W7Y8W0_9BACT|nr:hypothetical protein [Prosthecobacter vanneervenii]MBB5031410.1 putative membrane-anchored protein [Prosthecobacter vanneervenii]
MLDRLLGGGINIEPLWQPAPHPPAKNLYRREFPGDLGISAVADE